jgi:hypothetical protein
MYGEDTDGEPTGNYIKDHWQGNLTLPLSYWVNGTLISAVSAGIIFTVASSIESSDTSLQSWALGMLALNLAALAISVWGLVGIWRSSSRHEQRGGSPAWASIAKFMVIVGALNLVGELSTNSKQLLETSQIATGSDPIGSPAKLSIDGRNMVLDGWLAAGTAERFKSFLDTNPNVDQLILTSQGGRIREGLRISQMVVERNLSTSVSGECSSACTMVFLASNVRSLNANSSLGFHSPSGVGLSDEEAQEASPAMRLAYDQAKLPYEFIKKAMDTPSTTLWYPSEEELITAGAINRFAPSRIQQNHEAEIKDLQKKGSIKVDDYTTLTKANIVENDLIITYVVSLGRSELDWKRISPDILRDSQAKVCSDKTLRVLVNSGVAYRYTYIDKNGAMIGKLAVTDCS